MKKSTIFMVVYIVILFVAPIVGLFYDSNIITQIALAATISGIFFAIADLFSNLSKEWKRQAPFCEKELQAAGEVCVKLNISYNNLIKKVDTLFNKTKNPPTKTKLIKIKNKIIKDQVKFHRKFLNKQGHIKFRNTAKRMHKIFNALNVALFSLGIAIFLLLCWFPNIIVEFNHRQEVFSIYGCAFVFLNYIITDTAEERIIKKVKKYRINISELKELTKGIDKNIKESEKEDKRTDIIPLISSKSEAQNGQT